MKINPVLRSMPPSTQFWVLILIFFLCYGFFSILSSLAIISFLGIKSVEGLQQIFDYSDPRVILSMKIAHMIGSVGSFIVSVHIFSRLCSENYIAYLKLNRKPLPMTFIMAGLIFIFVQPFINATAELNSHFPFPEFMAGVQRWVQETEDQYQKLTDAFLEMKTYKDLALNLFVIGFVAALSEEIFFRGALQRLLMEWTGSIHKGVWITAVAFSAFHMEFSGFFPRIILGALLGYMFAWSRSLWLPVFAHFVNNGAAVMMSFYVQKGKLGKEIENVGTGQGAVLPVIISVVLTSGFLLSLYRMEKVRQMEEELKKE